MIQSLPKNIPNLNQSLFKGVKILEFNKPKIKNMKEIIIDLNQFHRTNITYSPCLR